MNEPPGYLGQVDACRFLAMQRLQMARESVDPSSQSQLLLRSVEFAVRTVLTAWQAPIAKPEKLWAVFDETLAPLVCDETTEWTRHIRSSASAPDDVLRNAEAHIRAITALADVPPPEGFAVSDRLGITWEDLVESDRRFLSDALRAARIHVPEARLWLFGSRATGEARKDSDYDVLLVVPDPTTGETLGQAMGFIWLAAKQYQVTVDHTSVTTSLWLEPDGANETLVAEVRAYGIEVPAPAIEGP